MIQVNTLRKQPGATHKIKRVGRGRGSGWGCTAGRGEKGQKSRSGRGKPGIGFEGGQTPLYRRVPKRGFKNIWAPKTAILNVKDLDTLDPAQVSEISLDGLKKAKVLKGTYDRLHILGTGETSKSFAIKAHKVTKSAEEKITKAGGKIEILTFRIPRVKFEKKEARKARLASS